MTTSKAPQSPSFLDSKKPKRFSLIPPGMEKRRDESKPTSPAGGGNRKRSVVFTLTKLRSVSRLDPQGSKAAAADSFYEKLLTKGYSQDELTEYKQVFSLFDTDGSGSIGTKELGNCMKSLGMSPQNGELETLIQEVDQDGNGEIDFEEFCDVMKRMSSKGKVSWDDVIKQCFDVFDRSGSGSITEDDFRAILRGLGGIRDDRTVQDIFSEFDVDGNNMIDFAEFSNMVKSYMTEEDIEGFGNKK